MATLETEQQQFSSFLLIPSSEYFDSGAPNVQNIFSNF
jgi:hypothetical protein